ncbi:hypothetical protein MRX96_044386 [Rhipicephalus microplus]
MLACPQKSRYEILLTACHLCVGTLAMCHRSEASSQLFSNIAGQMSVTLAGLVAVRHHPGYRKKEHVQQCHVCGYSTTNRRDFRKHGIIHTGKSQFKCDQCGRAFNRKDNLKEHARLHSGERPFRCHLCPSDFTQKSGLAHHLRTHRRGKLLADRVQL